LAYDAVIEAPNGGDDTVIVSRVGNSSNYGLPANVENGIVDGNEDFTLYGNELNNRLTGNGAANTLNGDAGNDVLVGGDGDDLLIGGVGNDALDGGPGNDTASYASSPRAVLINLAGQAATDGIETDTFSSIENAIGSQFDDTIVSSDGANSMDGGGGSNTVSYAAASRAMLINLAGHAAADGIVTDTLISFGSVIGSRFNDTLLGDALDNVLDGGPGGADQINGAGGNDTASYALSPRAVLINLGAQVTADGIDTDTLTSIENAIGSSFSDTIIGDGGANVLDGGAGADSITGGAGNDIFVFLRGQANGEAVVDCA
jgi:Ca2+-binding RTX toxin-like protein